MEILETQDPEKKRLMDEAKMHKDNLTNDMHFLSERTEKVLTNALIIGGALALTYVMVRQLRGKSRKKKSKTVKLVAQAQPTESAMSEESDETSGATSILSEIGTKIANEATLFLLDMAKEKLKEYLQSGKEKQA